LAAKSLVAARCSDKKFYVPSAATVLRASTDVVGGAGGATIPLLSSTVETTSMNKVTEEQRRQMIAEATQGERAREVAVQQEETAWQQLADAMRRLRPPASH
jgi:hypothetical protein